jgi:hypothetical protein
MCRSGKFSTRSEIEPPAGVDLDRAPRWRSRCPRRSRPTGSLRLLAVFIDSQNSPWLVVPSPVETNTTSSP